MIVELLYTSAPQGLKQGSRGFCTVVCTAGLPINLAQRLESLSAYRHLYQPGDPKSDRNPVCYSHLRFGIGGRTVSVLSRIAAYGVDYSQRTNKLAHHLVFDATFPRCGPAAILSQSSVMRAEWDGQCRTLAAVPPISDVPQPAAPCSRWKQVAGDPGWAGVVASAWLKGAAKPTWIVFAENQSEHLCELMREAVALLPEKSRWKATFSTYCTNLPPDVDCKVRCVVAGSDEARMSIARGDVIDLSKKLGLAPNSIEVLAARAGQVIGGEEKRAAPTAQPIHALPASSITTSQPLPELPDLGQLEHFEAYELQPVDLAAPSSAPPKKLPPRPLVPPKHMKAPSPNSAPANPVNPVWFIAGASSVIVTLLLAIGFIVVSRSRTAVPQNEQALNGGSNVEKSEQNTGPTPAQAIEPSPLLPPKSTSPEVKGSAPPPTKPSPKLICTPASKEMEANEIKQSQIAQVSFEGSNDPIEPSKIQILRNGVVFSDLSVKANGELSWEGEKPELSSTEEIFNFEICYPLAEGTSKVSFSLKLKAGESPDLDFKIVDSTHKLTDGFALGSELVPEFIRDRDSDEPEPGKNRRWLWERSDLDKDNWQQVSVQEKYLVSLADVQKRLRVKLTYATRNNKGQTEIGPKPVTVLSASIWKLSITDILTPPKNPKVHVEVVPPKREASGSTLTSYGAAKIGVTNNHLDVSVDRIMKSTDIEKVSQKFVSLRSANDSYGAELKKFKNNLLNANKNSVAQALNNGFSFREMDSVEGKCEIAKDRRKLQPLVEQILKTAELISKPDYGNEFEALKKMLPLLAAQPSGLQAAIGEFSSFRLQWDSLVTSEQAFLLALENAKNEPYLFETVGKIKIEQTEGKQTLIECPLAVSLRVTFSAKLENLMKEIGPINPATSTAGGPAANSGPKAAVIQAPPIK